MSAPSVSQSNASGTGPPASQPGEQVELQQRSPKTFGVVLLAGALKPSPLRQSLDIPALCLPLSAEMTLLDAWLDLLNRSEGCSWLKILVSSSPDVNSINQGVAEWLDRNRPGFAIEVSLDKGAWRGPGGLLRDIVIGYENSDPDCIIAAEASCLPPVSLAPLLHGLAGDAHGVVACDDEGREPAGLYAFRVGTLQKIPARGYYDIKEQLLPALYEQGIPVRCAETTDVVCRIRSSESYLHAVQCFMDRQGISDSVSKSASIAGDARVHKGCVIQAGVTIEEGAIVHRSVILQGATIGGGSIVANSVVGCDATIGARQMIKNGIVGEAVEKSRQIPVLMPGIFSSFRPHRDRDKRMVRASREW